MPVKLVLPKGAITPLAPYQLREASDLSYSLALYRLQEFQVLVISFGGTYGYGCLGNKDAMIMEAVIKAAMLAWNYLHAIILDLSAMCYQWGDMIGDAISATGPVPVLIVTSPLNRIGLTSYVSSEMDGDPAEWLFESVDTALAELQQRFQANIFIRHTTTGEVYQEIYFEDGQVILIRSYTKLFQQMWVFEDSFQQRTQIQRRQFLKT